MASVDRDSVRLELFRVSPSTLKLYTSALKDFLSFVRSSNSDSSRSLSSSSADSLLYSYIHYLFVSGLPRSRAVNAVFGLCLYHPALKDKLPRSKAALCGWQRLVKSESYPPVPRHIAFLIAASLCKGGSWSAGVAVLLAFHCYLRVSELCALRLVDVISSSNAALRASSSSSMGLQLSTTKTGRHQFVVITDVSVQRLLTMLLQQARAEGRQTLFPFDVCKFRSLFTGACSVLGLAHLRFTPHSLRHGGATHDFLQGVPFEDIMLRGRWKSSDSARTYIQAGRALLSLQRLPPSVSQVGDALTRCIVPFFVKYLPQRKR